MGKLPNGIVAFLFSDIEGSTKLLHELGDRYADILIQHRELLRKAFADHGGIEMGTEGDSFFVVFERASDAMGAACDAQRALTAHDWKPREQVRVRIGVHAGETQIVDDDYVGINVHIAARVMSAAHGGQILVTRRCWDLATDQASDHLSVRDLGEHGLKDIPGRTQLLQVLHPDFPDTFPPPRTLDVRPNNLPARLSTLIGRQALTRDLLETLPTTRLLSLVGAGGVGKTRLALELAYASLDDFPDGVWLVELGSLSEADDVIRAVAAALSLREEAGRDLEQSLLNFLSVRGALVVLDNCEHLIDTCAALATSILRSAASVRIIATSREPLGVSGETAWRVPSLGLPTGVELREIAAADSVRLFVERAHALDTTFELTIDNAADVSKICTRLDGIPLAVELAAAYVPALAPSEISARLSDRFKLLWGGSRGAIERQQTLRATIDWSYRLLTSEEHTMLDRASVFAGTLTLEAAEIVCGQGLDEEVVDLVSRLVAKSLVTAERTPDGTRYGMLETIRQYVRERLADGELTGEIEGRHAEYYATLVSGHEADLAGPDQAQWLARLDMDYENISAGLRWMIDRHPDRALEMAAALWKYWWIRGRWAEGASWLRATADRAGWPRTKVGAKARWGTAFLDGFRGSTADRDELLAAAADIQRSEHDVRGLAYTTWSQGYLDSAEKGFELLRECVPLARKSGDGQVTAWALLSLGSRQQDYRAHRTLHQEGLEVARASGERWSEAMALTNLGEISYFDGDFASGTAMIQGALGIFREIGDVFGVREALRNLAIVAWLRGEIESVREHVADARRMLSGTDAEHLLVHFYYVGIRAELEGGVTEGAESLLRYASALAQKRPDIPEISRIEASLDGTIGLGVSDRDRLFAAARQIERIHVPVRSSLGMLLAPAESLVLAEAAAVERGVEEARLLAQAAMTSAKSRQPWLVAECVELLARLVARDGPEESATMLGAAEAVREIHGGRRLPGQDVACAEVLQRTRSALGPKGAEAAWQRGRAMTPEEGFAYAGQFR
ncbi:MAG: ATP-binding protein [Actinomycetota bacterium]